MSLGQAALLLGRLDQARSLAERAIRYISFRRGTVAHALDLLGEVATHSDCFDAVRGEVHYREALALAEPRAMRPLVAHCHLGIGKLSGRTGKREQAWEHLTIAATMYREMDMQFWLQQAAVETAAVGLQEWRSSRPSPHGERGDRSMRTAPGR